jgi:hypothetical protein
MIQRVGRLFGAGGATWSAARAEWATANINKAATTNVRIINHVLTAEKRGSVTEISTASEKARSARVPGPFCRRPWNRKP